MTPLLIIASLVVSHGKHQDHGTPEEMGAYIAKMEEPARAAWQQPDEVVRTLGPIVGQTVCDIGTGPGYFALRFAAAVGEKGRVYAVDVEPKMLDVLRQHIAAAGVSNVTPLLALPGSSLLADASCDLVVIVDTYHHFPDRVQYLRQLAKSLKPGGRLVNIDFHKKEQPVGPPMDARIAREEFIKEAKAAGLEVAQEPTFLPYQYFFVLRPAALASTADEPTPTMVHKRSVAYGTDGMVAASHPAAVQIGVDVLKKGGSAVDAALAVNIALAVMEPGMCGMGGDLFAIVWDNKDKRLYGLNASGRSPLKLTVDKVRPAPDGTIPMTEPVAWSTPGAVDGWAKLHQRFGRLEWRDLFTPAITAAERGVPIAPVVAKEWDWPGWLAKIKDHHGFAATFLFNGEPPKPGQILQNPELAKALREVARGGRDAFYKGKIARDIVEVSHKVGGFFELQDFDREHAEWVEPVSTTYAGVSVWELAPNTQGMALLQMLNILESFDLKKLGRGSPLYWHILIEAKKLAFEDRARYYADPAFTTVPIEKLLSKEYARKQAARIDLTHAAERYEADAIVNRGDTTYLAVADKDGNMVSLIQSNFMPFGTGHIVDGFGLQNRGALFSLKAGHPNVLAPGKRPFHTIMPGFLTKDGKPLMAFGVMGGNMQPLGHMQVLVNHLVFGDDLQLAGDRPRFQHEGSSEPTGTVMKDGGVLFLEAGVPQSIRKGLIERGHRIKEGGYFGGYQAVMRENGMFLGASESRKDGVALGL